MRARWRRLAKGTLARLPVIGRRWDPVARREWLLEQLPKRSVGAEVGVWRGDFSVAILRIVRPGRLHLIDPWRSAPQLADASGPMLSARGQTEMDSIYDSVRARFATQVAAGVVVLHRALSHDAAAEIGEESLDWVYIDGDHTYEAVRDDLATYARRVRAGGYVAGDDYAQGGMFGAGVKRAVDEAVAAGDLELVVQRDRQFLLRKRAT